MELGKDFRKVFYAGGAIAVVLSLLLIGRTVFQVIPIIGFSAAAPHLGMSVFFLAVGVAMLVLARRDGKKEAEKQAGERKES